MQIECILKREGGTHVEIDGINYHFAPLPDGAHVADVADKIHVKRFLSIPEAYELYDAESAKNELSSVIHADTVDSLTDGEKADLLESDEDADEQADDRAALVEQYEAKFGKKPNGRMSIEKLREALAG